MCMQELFILAYIIFLIYIYSHALTTVVVRCQQGKSEVMACLESSLPITKIRPYLKGGQARDLYLRHYGLKLNCTGLPEMKNIARTISRELNLSSGT